ncbi:MAG: hypothetical protein KVP17_004144 [Porospora cf. gigantea B]|uniref:uncharacterized protein n=2 Tax=Porospora cf. gigantea B TaxID=2853592 RepID=UPI003571B42F|nr:MAG: hypothetical protein KVP17_004144 [Porospora cf. gigantea B]
MVGYFCHCCVQQPREPQDIGHGYRCPLCLAVGFVEIIDGNNEDDPRLFDIAISDRNRETVEDILFNPLGRLTREGAGPRLAGVEPMGFASQLVQTFRPLILRNQGAAMDRVIQLLMEHDPTRHGPPPASNTVVENLPGELLSEQQARDQQCAICQEPFSPGDEVKLLTRDAAVCSHFFHNDCILPWLRQHNSCPICRYELPTDDPDYEEQRRRLREGIHRTMSSDNPANPSRQQPEVAEPPAVQAPQAPLIR